MKVQEKGSDRRAEVNIHIQEQVDELAEYDQYVDKDDKALCCYVPVEEGNVIKLTGRFNGTTSSAAWDLYVDDVLRKSNNKISKTVILQKNVKLDAATALVQLIKDDGEKKILDTQMIIAPVSGITSRQDGNGKEKYGTIELHLYVLRSFGTEAKLDSRVFNYLDEGEYDSEEEGEEQEDESNEKKQSIEAAETDEDKDKSEKSAPIKQKKGVYRSTVPEYMIEFEKNCEYLDSKNINAWKKKMDAKRPSEKPWAIFRFHYRSQEAINAKGWKMSHDPQIRGKGEEAHVLELEAVPPLMVGTTKPGKADDESTQASSTPKSGTPLASGTPLGHNSPLFRQPTSPLAQRHNVDHMPSEGTVADGNEDKTEAAKHIESTPATPSMTAPAPIAPMFPAPSAILKRPTPTTPSTGPPEAKRTKKLSMDELRQKTIALKEGRANIAKRRAAELEPHMAPVRKEKERLLKEYEEAKAAYKEELDGYREDSAALENYRKVHGDSE